MLAKKKKNLMADLHHNKNHDIFGGGYEVGQTAVYGDQMDLGGQRFRQDTQALYGQSPTMIKKEKTGLMEKPNYYDPSASPDPYNKAAGVGTNYGMHMQNPTSST